MIIFHDFMLGYDNICQNDTKYIKYVFQYSMILCSVDFHIRIYVFDRQFELHVRASKLNYTHLNICIYKYIYLQHTYIGTFIYSNLY